MDRELKIPVKIWQQMVLHCTNSFPEEACGLLAGLGKNVHVILPVDNILHSPVRFRMDPGQQLAAFQLIDDQGLELLAMYHSHPEGPDFPSQTDIAEAYYPETIYIILSGKDKDIYPYGYTIESGRVSQVTLNIYEQR